MLMLPPAEQARFLNSSQDMDHLMSAMQAQDAGGNFRRILASSGGKLARLGETPTGPIAAGASNTGKQKSPFCFSEARVADSGSERLGEGLRVGY